MVRCSPRRRPMQYFSFKQPNDHDRYLYLFAASLIAISCSNGASRAPGSGGATSTSNLATSGGAENTSDGDDPTTGGTTKATSSKAAGGKTSSSVAKGGTSAKGGDGTGIGGKSDSSSASARGGASSSAGGNSSEGGTAIASSSSTGPASYALPPPSECSNQWAVQGCKKGDPNSDCGGKCANDFGATSKSACEGGKEGVPVQYACPRHLLFSTEMMQAAIDDGYQGKFNYAVVGHDPDPDNLDKGLPDSCCQCYQLVFDAPRYLTNSTLTPPIPLIVQSFNTQASGPAGFDVYMGAGGLGAYNACDANGPMALSQAGTALYTGYPDIGQPSNGGVKPGPSSLQCDDQNDNLSDALIAASACQDKIVDACNEITATNEALQAQTRKSCIQSNQASSYYHENWKLYVKRVACPERLTDVTGCKLAEESALVKPDPDVQTAAQASKAGFSNMHGGEPYHTTTMQDCCMPSCAWKNKVGSPTVGGYSSFYSCLADGSPVTQPQ